MKVFQIVDGFCYSEVTHKFNSAEATKGYFPPKVLFVDAPDYVFQGWIYDETKEGDARFIQPAAPEGWAYDEKTGTFYDLNHVENFNTPAEKREYLYNTEKINWEDGEITITMASQLWQYYAAEGSSKASELQKLIAEAKAKIREQYPN